MIEYHAKLLPMAEVTCQKQNLLTSEETFKVYCPREGKKNSAPVRRSESPSYILDDSNSALTSLEYVSYLNICSLQSLEALE
jgi:hypothetical protein